MSEQDSFKGVVVKTTGNVYLVDTDKGVLTCSIKGKFRIKGIKTTNPAAVGDYVELNYNEKSETYVIHNILPRQNYLIRRSVNLSKQYHIIAANIDQCVVMASIRSPKTSMEFVDRMLVSAEAYGISSIVLLNKIDLLNDSEEDELIEWVSTYEMAGYKIYPISVSELQDPKKLEYLFKDKTSVISGHSGVGKSTLLNTLHPELSLQTSKVSEQHAQGKHTTTFAEMHNMSFGGKIIDTPGIRGLGVVDIEPSELNHFFPEFLKRKPECKFNNCMHLNEPQCAVKAAIEEGDIPNSRYASYLSILETDQNYR